MRITTSEKRAVKGPHRLFYFPWVFLPRVRVDTGNPVLCRVGTTLAGCSVWWAGFKSSQKRGGSVRGEGILSRKNRASFALGTWKDLESHFFWQIYEVKSGQRVGFCQRGAWRKKAANRQASIERPRCLGRGGGLTEKAAIGLTSLVHRPGFNSFASAHGHTRVAKELRRLSSRKELAEGSNLSSPPPPAGG